MAASSTMASMIHLHRMIRWLYNLDGELICLIIIWGRDSRIEKKNIVKKEVSYTSGRARLQKLRGQGGQNAPQNWNFWVLFHFYVTISKSWGCNYTPCTPGCAATEYIFVYEISLFGGVKYVITTPSNGWIIRKKYYFQKRTESKYHFLSKNFLLNWEIIFGE